MSRGLKSPYDRFRSPWKELPAGRAWIRTPFHRQKDAQRSGLAVWLIAQAVTPRPAAAARIAKAEVEKNGTAATLRGRITSAQRGSETRLSCGPAAITLPSLFTASAT